MTEMTNWEKKEHDHIMKQLEPLKGGLVVGSDTMTGEESAIQAGCSPEEAKDFNGECWPVVIMRDGRGRRIQLVISRDAEGNGGGYPFVEVDKP